MNKTKGIDIIMIKQIRIIFFIFGILFADILVYIYKVNTIVVIIALIGCTTFYKVLISEKFSDIYNIYSFKFTISFNNLFELMGSFLVSIIILESDFAEHNYNIVTISLFIITGLIIYRFLFFNILKGKLNEK